MSATSAHFPVTSLLHPIRPFPVVEEVETGDGYSASTGYFTASMLTTSYSTV